MSILKCRATLLKWVAPECIGDVIASGSVGLISNICLNALCSFTTICSSTTSMLLGPGGMVLGGILGCVAWKTVKKTDECFSKQFCLGSIYPRVSSAPKLSIGSSSHPRVSGFHGITRALIEPGGITPCICDGVIKTEDCYSNFPFFIMIINSEGVIEKILNNSKAIELFGQMQLQGHVLDEFLTKESKGIKEAHLAITSRDSISKDSVHSNKIILEVELQEGSNLFLESYFIPCDSHLNKYCGFFFDISGAQELESLIKSMDIIDHVFLAILNIDTQSFVSTYGNVNAIEEIYGIDDLAGRNIFDFIPQDEVAPDRKGGVYTKSFDNDHLMQQLLHSSIRVNIANQVNGRISTIEMKSYESIKTYQGCSKLYIVVVKNISAQVTLESQLSGKYIFQANIAHSIGNFLHLIITDMQIRLESTGTSLEVQELINGYLENLMQIQELQLKIRTYGKLFSEHHHIEEVGRRLVKEVRGIREAQLKICQTEGSEVEINVINHIDEECVLYGDFGRFKDVVFNYIDNARKYAAAMHTQGGGCVNVGIEMEWQNESQSFIKIIVNDNGLGLSKEKVDLLMESTDPQVVLPQKDVKGTAFGFMIAKRSVKIMNGIMFIESEGEGKGVTITLKLPFNNRPSSLCQIIDVEAPAFVETKCFNFSKSLYRVLIVDDDKNSRRIIDRAVETAIIKIAKDNYEDDVRKNFDSNSDKGILIVDIGERSIRLLVDFACDGDEALEKLKEERGLEKKDPINRPFYDLVFMDMRMGRMNGWAATSQYRKFERDFSDKHAKIALLTATPIDEESSIFDYILTKPALIKEYAGIIQTII